MYVKVVKDLDRGSTKAPQNSQPLGIIPGRVSPSLACSGVFPGKRGQSVYPGKNQCKLGKGLTLPRLGKIQMGVLRWAWTPLG